MDIEKKLVPYQSTAEELARELDTDSGKGLSASEARERLQRFGPNVISTDTDVSILKLLANQFKSPVIYLLIAAALLSAWYREWPDAIAILLVILINAGTGFYMEWQALRSMKALRDLTRLTVRLYRDGNEITVNVEDIVPGDLIYLESGDIVPADGRIIQSSGLQVDEATLTGESIPVEKQAGDLSSNVPLAEQTNSLFKGTAVRKGNVRMLCTGTGMKTELGHIATLLTRTADSATPLEKKIAVFSKQLLLVCLALIAIVVVAGLIHGLPTVEIIRTSLVLGVAAIPEGLPVVATLSLAKGMLRMARRHVIIRQLSAVETLGTTTVICTDKTGTLTENDLELVQLELPPDFAWKKGESLQLCPAENYRRFFQVAVLCNTASLGDREKNGNAATGDPLEISLLKFAKEHPCETGNGHTSYVKTDEVPFSSDTRVMAMQHKAGNSFLVTAKGATENLLPHCRYVLEDKSVRELNDEDRKKWQANTEKLAAGGLKPLAFAWKEKSEKISDMLEELVFAGLAGFLDPPRKDIEGSISQCREAGIKVVMLTGDHPATAAHVADMLHITETPDVIKGSDMASYDAVTPEEKKKWLNTHIFARVTPAQKLDLVNALQDEHEVVAMTGDGVNDAPALKKADIGVAMGIRGSQVSKETADMILQDDSFNSLVKGIEQGRVIFDNIRRFIIFLLSCNLSELLVVGIIAVLGLSFRLLPLQILLINLVTDVLPALALGVTKGNGKEMERMPQKLNAPIISRAKWRAITIYAAIIGAFTFLGGEIAEMMSLNANNVLFFTLTFSQLLHVLNMVNAEDAFFNNHIVKSKYVWLAILGSTMVMLLVAGIPALAGPFRLHVPGMAEWAIIMLCSLGSLLTVRIIKKLGVKSFLASYNV
ncbi:cation-transporting P-type ATPase [Chitinophaga filiformis]|uniref:cation-translocating P-type ATPase n=1 Tax=Chitinophaga filiformis TaxID=104663 RepID=UPI001F1BD406|nr:cation-transporting P-type ATPase [Chitinophaga filiformis]MCF6405321.1 cation-transporting P-type ATPase [Chitinophaga filiformis]